MLRSLALLLAVLTVAAALQVRPRLGDFIAVSLGAETLVTPRELVKYREHRVGAHGSLLPEEMRIPFVCLTPESPSASAGGTVMRPGGGAQRKRAR